MLPVWSYGLQPHPDRTPESQVGLLPGAGERGQRNRCHRCAYNSSGRLCIYKRPGPAHLLHFSPSGIYLYASTEAILRQAVARTWLRREQAEKVHVNSGDIVQIDLCGNIRTDYFDMGWAPYPHWGSWGQFSSCLSSPEPCYLEQLKNVAASFGYTAEQIDQLLMEGWSTDEIEDAMYGYDYL